jgi:ribosomal protein S18 acetylase RimI-like enzyme
MVPSETDVEEWIATARKRGLRALRTGALFPAASRVFVATGFVQIDSLLLLQRDLTVDLAPDSARAESPSRTPRIRRGPTRRLTDARMREAVEVDERAFGKRWSNDATSLAGIREATPSHRNRMIVERGTLRGFAMSGRAGSRGYIQRLAVAPESQRCGFGRTLVLDALVWMRRHRVDKVLVNTAADNVAALALYESFGFRRDTDTLRVLELALDL